MHSFSRCRARLSCCRRVAGNSGDAPSYSTEPIGSAKSGGSYHSAVGHYRLRFPAGWVTIDARGVSDKAIEAMIQRNPGVADDLRRWRRSVTRPGALFAGDFSPFGQRVRRADAFVPNVSVLFLRVPKSIPDRLVLRMLVNQVVNDSAPGSPAGSGRVSRETLAGRPARRLAFIASLNGAAGQIKIASLDDMVVGDHSAYEISCSAPATYWFRYRSVCNSIAQSFTLDDG